MPIERQLIFRRAPPPFGTDNYHSRLWKYKNAMARGKTAEQTPQVPQHWWNPQPREREKPRPHEILQSIKRKNRKVRSSVARHPPVNIQRKGIGEFADKRRHNVNNIPPPDEKTWILAQRDGVFNQTRKNGELTIIFLSPLQFLVKMSPTNSSVLLDLFVGSLAWVCGEQVHALWPNSSIT